MKVGGMKVTANVTVTWRGAEYLNSVGSVMDEVLQRVANDCRSTARLLVPVRTGKLKSEIVVLKGDEPFEYYVGGQCEDSNDKRYAAYVEIGTYKMAAQPYLRPALKSAKKNTKKYLEEELRVRGLVE